MTRLRRFSNAFCIALTLSVIWLFFPIVIVVSFAKAVWKAVRK